MDGIPGLAVLGVLALRLRTPLQVGQHLTLALGRRYQTSEVAGRRGHSGLRPI